MERSQTRAEWLAGEIAEAIVTGAFEPGMRLDEQTLAERYEVSRTPVREALRHLDSSGLIETRPRRGAVVAAVTAGRLEEMFVAMGEVEASCARLAALGMSPIERRRLQSLHEGMAGLVMGEAVSAYAEANTAFHGALYAGAHNAVLAEVAIGLRRRLAPYRRAQFRAAGRLARSHAEHADIVAAILAGDAARAHAAMIHHVSLVEEAFETLIGGASGETPSISKRSQISPTSSS